MIDKNTHQNYTFCLLTFKRILKENTGKKLTKQNIDSILKDTLAFVGKHGSSIHTCSGECGEL